MGKYGVEQFRRKRGDGKGEVFFGREKSGGGDIFRTGLEQIAELRRVPPSNFDTVLDCSVARGDRIAGKRGRPTLVVWCELYVSLKRIRLFGRRRGGDDIGRCRRWGCISFGSCLGLSLGSSYRSRIRLVHRVCSIGKLSRHFAI